MWTLGQTQPPPLCIHVLNFVFFAEKACTKITEQKEIVTKLRNKSVIYVPVSKLSATFLIYFCFLDTAILFSCLSMPSLSVGCVNTEGLFVKRSLLNLLCLICVLPLSLSLFPLEIGVTFKLITFTVHPYIQFGSAISNNALKIT